MASRDADAAFRPVVKLVGQGVACVAEIHDSIFETLRVVVAE